MPIYSIRNNRTNEEFEINLKYSELTEYFEANPDYQQIFTKFPGVVDPVSVGVRKTDSSFRDVLSKAKNAHLHSNIEY